MNTLPTSSFRSSSASSSLCVRSTTSIAGFSARGFDHLPYVEGIGCRNDQQARPRDVGLDEHRRIRGIPRDRGNVARTQVLDQFALLLGDDERDLLLAERVGDPATDPAVPDQHHLSGEPGLVDRPGKLGERVFPALQPAGEAEYDRRAGIPAPEHGDEHAERRGDRDLHDRAGHRDAPDRQQVLERQVQADAEHQQDHADFGELAGQLDIGNEARRARTDYDPGDEVADQWRHLEPRCREPGEHRQSERRGDGRQQADFVRHTRIAFAPKPAGRFSSPYRIDLS
jgi:hypothetical protein